MPHLTKEEIRLTNKYAAETGRYLDIPFAPKVPKALKKRDKDRKRRNSDCPHINETTAIEQETPFGGRRRVVR
jgi:hypothetical protein